MSSAKADTLDSWPLSFQYFSPSLGRLAGQVGAGGLPVVERATCPAPPCQGLLDSGLRAWPGPECVSICVCWRREGLGLEAQCPGKICHPILENGHLEAS